MYYIRKKSQLFFKVVNYFIYFFFCLLLISCLEWEIFSISSEGVRKTPQSVTISLDTLCLKRVIVCLKELLRLVGKDC